MPHPFAGRDPTETVALRIALKFTSACEISLPNENGVVVPARHAYSHSASVGSRHPSHLEYKYASHQLTLTTG